MLIAVCIITLLATGHALAAAYLLRHLRKKPRPNHRHWQMACIVFPAGVGAYLLWLARQELRN